MINPGIIEIILHFVKWLIFMHVYIQLYDMRFPVILTMANVVFISSSAAHRFLLKHRVKLLLTVAITDICCCKDVAVVKASSPKSLARQSTYISFV